MWNNHYRYTFTGYDENGNEQKIVKVIDRKLCQDAYLKIYAEGGYGGGWSEVAKPEVPSEIMDKLNHVKTD
ncbi:uncharacterized protein YxeA [Neobacillus niacini]|uniref:DUF1093 domain-containing protein n=1 Tax=Neobacillus niacini TaxID=86668 RepID=UPI00285542AE|nr:DUF1093 domain-containing protein [Neobacillus niacini]MDR7079365.1 uncharacterized protein YxeA [Neobacillus niacini]